MPHTDTSLDNFVGASFMAARFHLCSMLDTYPSLLGTITTSFMFANFDLCTMLDTYSSLLGLITTSFMFANFTHARLQLCTMPYANTSFDGMVGAFSNRAQPVTSVHPILETDSFIVGSVEAFC
mmetsp:Transcript_29537/g.53578  ORF Transcript_29537/g.53578 Transcript_29537/m.53578 type:complete len:124 (-) Transcript_29537:1568-1939(-)